MIARAKNFLSTDEVRKKVLDLSRDSLFEYSSNNSLTYHGMSKNYKSKKSIYSEMKIPSYEYFKESKFEESKLEAFHDDPDLDPKRDVYEVDHYDIDWESGPIGSDVQLGDTVIYCGYNPLLVNGGEYTVYLVHNDGIVDLVRTDNQNFTYGQSMVQVSTNSLYWRRGEYGY